MYNKISLYMFFDSLTVSLKHWFLKKKCNRLALGDRFRPTTASIDASVGLIIDLDAYDVSQVVAQLAKAFDVSSSKIRVLGFSKVSLAQDYPSFIPTDQLSWFKGVTDPSVISFGQYHYQYLVDFHDYTTPSVVYASLQTHALIRVGFTANTSADLIVNQAPENSLSLFKELQKYIQKLTVNDD